MLFIPEGDLYRLASKSRLKSAERFESWTFDKVIPQIRITGGHPRYSRR
jgi:prophage antirepressor-like protein